MNFLAFRSRRLIFPGSNFNKSCVRFYSNNEEPPTDKRTLEEELLELDNEDDKTNLQSHNEFLQSYQLKAAENLNVFLIQPFKRMYRYSLTRHDFMLEESKGLVDTLGWKVCGTESVGMDSFQKRSYFGSGQLEDLKGKISAVKGIDTIFLSSYMINASQRQSLESFFEYPVLDRYNIILQIFQRHARTKEAKLQVALAEIPYLRKRLQEDWQIENEMKHSSARFGSRHFEKKDFYLKTREKRIKMALDKVKDNRAILRKSRQKSKIPTVAVVGYTNCGKTTLIKSLTESATLVPRDKLFATLDVTVHATHLVPSNLQTLFVDTVGFISDIPTSLIASFSATLEDVALADVIVHVRDISNPDNNNQNIDVLETLRKLGICNKLLENMITVGNKIDKIDPNLWEDMKSEDFIPISATEGFGLNILMRKLNKAVIEATERFEMTFRVKTGGPEDNWLRQNVAIQSVTVDEKNENYLLMTVVLLEFQFQKFKKHFLS